MIDLHLHFDGSLLPRTVLELAKEQGIRLPAQEPDELKAFLTAPEDCKSLNEYLEKFELPLQVLQTREGIRRAMYTLICTLKEQGLLYAEVRFAPQLHTRQGLKQKEIVMAAVTGMQEALAGSFFKANLILCCMRGKDNQEANRETLYTAAQFLGRGVVAADLAGAEGLFPTRDFSGLFQEASELGLPFTIHAGEADGPDSIYAALEFGACRIGHGVRAAEDEGLLKLLQEKQLPLELCLTSNLQTKAVKEDGHPLLSFLRKGLAATVNTDNMTVSDTTLEKEFQKLKRMGMTEEEQKKLLFHAADAAFLSGKEKERLKDVIRKII